MLIGEAWSFLHNASDDGGSSHDVIKNLYKDILIFLVIYVDANKEEQKKAMSKVVDAIEIASNGVDSFFTDEDDELDMISDCLNSDCYKTVRFDKARNNVDRLFRYVRYKLLLNDKTSYNNMLDTLSTICQLIKDNLESVDAGEEIFIDFVSDSDF